MTRKEKALENHKKGYNCAQAVASVFSDITAVDEDTLYKMSEAFGGGMGGTKGVCGAVSAMVMVAGLLNSKGIEALPDTNKMTSYKVAGDMIRKFEEMNQTILCSRLKGEEIRSCDDCICDAVEIIETMLLK